MSAYASGSTVHLTSKAAGSGTNYTLGGGSETENRRLYHLPSFRISNSGSMIGGVDGHQNPGTTVYQWQASSLAPDGDLLGSTDTSNGTWAYALNDLNQLTQACTPNCSGTVLNYGYDRYGNRWGSPAVSLTFNNAANNHADSLTYDAAGNVLNDGSSGYTYDAENRITSVYQGTTVLATYVYDAEGRRVHESVGGVVKEYVYGAEGQELTVVDGSQNLLQGETYFDGRLLGTQEPSGFVWAHADELGTVRMHTNSAASPVETDISWPFGEYLNPVGSYSNLHFTGKYRDGESNLDYFGARYYSSSLGRFMTPDWSGAPEPVPYANLEDPQSLNLYSYVGNNPMTGTDPDGHCQQCAIQAVLAWIHFKTEHPAAAARVEQGAEGAGLVVGGAVTALAAASAEAGSFGGSTPMTVAAGMGAAGMFTAGLSKLTSAATGSGQAAAVDKAADTIMTESNPVGLAVTITTKGNLKAAKAAATVSDVAMAASSLTSATTAVEKAASVIGAIQAVGEISQTAKKPATTKVCKEQTQCGGN